jgi:hypothetical protein
LMTYFPVGSKVSPSCAAVPAYVAWTMVGFHKELGVDMAPLLTNS